MKRSPSFMDLRLLTGAALLALAACAAPLSATSAEDAELLFQSGIVFRSEGKHAEAIVTWQKLQSKFYDQAKWIAKSQVEIGETYELMGERDHALAELEKGVSLSYGFPHVAAQAQFARGKIFEDRQDRERAVFEYRQVVDKHANKFCAMARVRLGRCLALLGGDDEALAVLSDIRHPDDAEANLLAAIEIAGIRIRKGEERAAIAGLQDAAETYKSAEMEWAEAWFLIAERYQVEGRPDDSLSVLDAIQVRYPGYHRVVPRAMIMAGDVHKSLGDFDQALINYANVMKYHSKALEQVGLARRRIDALLAQAAVSDGAMSHLRTAEGVYSATQAIVNARAAIDAAKAKGNYGRGDRDGAIQDMKALFANEAVFNSDVELERLGRAQLSVQDMDGARQTFARLLEVAAERAKPEKYVLYRVQVPFWLGDRPAAIREADAALEVYADGQFGAELYFVRALTYDVQDDVTNCMTAYDGVISRYAAVRTPETSRFVAFALQRSAIRLVELGRRTEAIARFKQILTEYADSCQEGYCAASAATVWLKRLEGGG